MNKILGIREKEIKVLRRGAIVSAMTYIMWICSGFIVSVSHFVHSNYFVPKC